jgi:lipid-A-disaccharide synthase
VGSSIYFVAGETSGDNHGAALMQSLRRLDPAIQFSGRGGPRMAAIAGADFNNWSDAAGVVGLWEVVKQYGYFRQQFEATLAEIAARKPAAVVLIDYPGFNLRLAKALRKQSPALKIIYYISPQVWAWNRGRIPRMAKWLDLMLCIFPFEKELYEQSGLRTVFIGHPMIESLRAKRSEVPRDSQLIGFFPGSREREVARLFPLMIDVARELLRARADLRFEVAAASERLAAMINGMIGPSELPPDRFRVTTGESASLMQRAFAGAVASGTATLEAAYFRLPFVLVYKVSWPTYFAGRLLIKVKHLGMPNVLANKEVVPEFVQHRAKPRAVSAALLQLLNDAAKRQQMISEFDHLIAQLGEGGASDKAAAAVLAVTDQSPSA